MVDIQGAGSGWTDDFTPDVEYRTMAGAGKFLLHIQPGDCAPQVRTLTGDSQKTAIFQSAKIKAASYKSRYRIECEILHWSGFDQGPQFNRSSPYLAWPKIYYNKGHKLKQREDPQTDPQFI